ncbi:alpha-L-fucosidase [Schaalia sp. 19OD2882]|nr:alpha-L-fucosidase [Schaalia sp. 19OD2882]
MVNDRIHVGMPGVHGDYYSTEYQDVDGFGSAHPWEESRAIGGSYGYNRAENIEDYATAGQLTALIAQTVAKGGHFLLDVGPTADGRIPVIQQERLLQIGAWMDVAGPGIHASAVAAGWSVPEGVHPTLTRPSPADSRLTGSTLYLFVEAQAGAGERGLRLQAPAGVGVTGAVDLTSGEPLRIRTERGAAAAGAANTGDEGGAILFLQTPAPRADGCPAVVRVDLTCAQTS